MISQRALDEFNDVTDSQRLVLKPCFRAVLNGLGGQQKSLARCVWQKMIESLNDVMCSMRMRLGGQGFEERRRLLPESSKLRRSQSLFSLIATFAVRATGEVKLHDDRIHQACRSIKFFLNHL